MRRLLPLLACVFAQNLTAETHVVGFDARKHFACDDRIFASTSGVELVPGALEKDAHNPVMQADKPWENALNNLYPNVDWDGSQFQLWYKCVLNDKDVIAKLTPVFTIHDQGWMLLHATSRDGVTWTKPEHGIVEFDGSKANNAVTRDTPNVGVFRDAHDADAARRFKMLFDTGLGQVQARFSADGIHWAEPVKLAGLNARSGDTHTNAFWDERSGKYVMFTKHYLGERLQFRYESDDFLSWRETGLAIRSTPEEAKVHQTYCLEVFPCGSGYFGWVMMYHAGKDKSVDCELAWSPDTKQWRRLFPGRGFIPRGEAGSYDSMCIYGPAGRSIVQDGRHFILYGGSAAAHIGWKRHCLPCVARVREDGFAPLRAEARGECVTKPMLATGEPLRISADAAGGSIRVSVVDAPELASEPITRNLANAEVRWRGGDFASLKGRRVQLKFELERASLCAFSGLELPAERSASAALRVKADARPRQRAASESRGRADVHDGDLRRIVFGVQNAIEELRVVLQKCQRGELRAFAVLGLNEDRRGEAEPLLALRAVATHEEIAAGDEDFPAVHQ